MQTLTVQEVKAKAREYYAKRRLTAQHPDPLRRKCEYSVDGGEYRCAIGAALTSETLAWLSANGRQTCGFGGLVDWEYVSVEAGGHSQLCDIQDAHDSWARAAAHGSASAQVREREFLTLIQD